MQVEIKICGLRDPALACDCAAAGADAIGLVFHPASPRRVTPAIARAVAGALAGGTVVPVIVCVDMESAALLRLCELTGIRWVQLHGAEPPEQVRHLTAEGLRVIKTLPPKGSATLADRAGQYAAAAALLVECATGPLPGGTGRSWDWSAARPLSGRPPDDQPPLSDRHPLILAGGLTPGNIAAAIGAAAPDAVDVSSGVESAPGVKSLDLVREFIRAAKAAPLSSRESRPVFG